MLSYTIVVNVSPYPVHCTAFKCSPQSVSYQRSKLQSKQRPLSGTHHTLNSKPFVDFYLAASCMAYFTVLDFCRLFCNLVLATYAVFQKTCTKFYHMSTFELFAV